MKAFLDACTGSSDFQGIVLIDGPPCSATARRAIWSNSTAPGLLRTWLQQAIDDRQIDALRAVLAGSLSLAGRGRSLA